MKKLFVFLLAVVLAFTLVACGETAAPDKADSTDLAEDQLEDALDEAEDSLQDLTEQPAETEVPATEVPPEETPAPEKEDTDSNELRPDFIEAMNSYEAFYDEYIEFMDEFEKNSSDLKLLAQYAELTAKAAEFEKDFAAWEDEDMNDAELTYYTEVQLRITQKLLEASK